MNKKYKVITILSFIYFLSLEFSIAEIFVNQTGYLSNLPKIFYTETSTDSFYLIDVSNSGIVFKDEMSFFPIK